MTRRAVVSAGLQTMSSGEPFHRASRRAIITARSPSRSTLLTSVRSMIRCLVETCDAASTPVTLLPASMRPFVDGSATGSVFEQVFVYNGISRFGGATPLQVLAQQGVVLGLEGPGPSATRLFTGELGRSIGWTLPAALTIVAIGTVASARAGWRTPRTAGYLLWGSWLLALVGVFSVSPGIQASYLAALAPAIAAVVGIGLAHAWSHHPSSLPRVLALVVVGGTAGYGLWLLPATGTGLPSWLFAAAVVLGLVAVVELLASVRRPADATQARIAFGVAAWAVVLIPTVAAAQLVFQHQGAYDTPFQPRRETASIDALFIDTPKLVARGLPALESRRVGAPILAAVQTAAVGSVFAYESGEQVLAVGGFTGSGPAPSASEFADLIQRGRSVRCSGFPGPGIPASAGLVSTARSMALSRAY